MSIRRRYVTSVVVCDVAIAATLGVAIAQTEASALAVVAVAVAWVLAVAVSGAYAWSRLVTIGQEVRRLIMAAGGLLATAGTASYLAGAPLARTAVLSGLLTLPLASTVARVAARRRVTGGRTASALSPRILLVAGRDSAPEFNAFAASCSTLGAIVGAVVPVGLGGTLQLPSGAPVATDLARTRSMIDLLSADTVIVSAGHLSPDALRRLSWSLEDVDIDLLLAPGLTDIDLHRLRMHWAGGMPVLQIAQPRLYGGSRWAKTTFDRVAAFLLLLMLVPLLVGVALAVRINSSGPALFRQVRVGQSGREFTLYKFRTMAVDAEERREDLLELNEAEGPLFKLRADPRITSIGRVLRRYSLDELPQLYNVLRGDMSLVGPRPPLPSEVAGYSEDVRRRLLVKPGLTGLWQVSGRSDLSWEESVRLDLRYVDNWSLGHDVHILRRTAKAVVRGTGAY